MGNCTSSPTTSIHKADQQTYNDNELPPHRIPSAEAQLDELLNATGVQRLTTRIPSPGSDDGGKKKTTKK
ncbi:MAG: hypothetical protein LQ349_009806, partial [Xanthoria aureola]